MTQVTGTGGPASPVLVSFYYGDAYYEAAARRLAEDCARFGLDYDIVALESGATLDWLAVCRRKSSFFLEMHKKHQRPIFWLDVDSRLGKPLDVIAGATCDIAGFLRGFRYVRDFDPLLAPRFFAPFALYFNETPRVTAFLELMAGLERQHPGSATDDFFLQEAWLRHQQQLSVMILPPDLVGHEWPLTGDQCIYVGRSGNVSKFRSQAEQHTAPIFTPAHRQAALMFEAENALEGGQTEEALVLFSRAFAIEPGDALAERIGRLLRRAGRRKEAEEFLRQHRGGRPPGDSVDRSREPFWKRWLFSRQSE